MTIEDDIIEISEQDFKRAQQGKPRSHPSQHFEQDKAARHTKAQQDRQKREAREKRMRDRVERTAREDARKFNEWKSKSEFKDRNFHTPPFTIPPAAPTAAIPSVYVHWKQKCDHAFRNYSTLEKFPAPPSNPRSCANKTCRGEQRVLEACSCEIERAFRALGVNPKEERVKWHPDRFSACREDKRKEFMDMAKEIFQVVQKMYLASKG